MYLWTIFSYLLIPLKYNVHSFIAIANDHKIIQKKQRPGPNPDDMKTAIFVEAKKYKSSENFVIRS